MIRDDLVKAIKDVRLEKLPKIKPSYNWRRLGSWVEPMNQELIEVAKRINWFDNPETLVKNKDRFLCYFMQYCQAKDFVIVKKYFSQQQFRKALDTAPPGIIDVRSRAYWEIVLPKI